MSNNESAQQTKPLKWHKELSIFFKEVGLLETSQCLDTELVVLSRQNLEKLPDALETLVEKLMQCLEQHIDAREEVLEKADKTHHGLLVTKRKRSDNPEEQREEDEKDRVKRLDGEQIQIRATTKEVDQRINNFIQAKQHELDESNRTEFLNQRDPSADDITCARTDAREINRNIQMKFDIVNNEDGPLARSRTTQEEPKRPTGVDKASSTSTGADVSERLNNLQEHLNVKFDSTAKPPFSIFERIKILENTLMEIERQYPTWAAVHFHQPNRNFPPPPPVTYISRPNNQAVNNTTGMIPSQQQLHGSDKETVNNEATYLSTQITTAAPQQRVIRTQGRANSSLTRAVLDQLNRQKQISVTKQTIESSNP